MYTFIKPAFLTLASLATIGIIVHDTHIDRMTTVAIGVPIALATYGIVDNVLKKSDHTHIERASFSKHFVTSSQGITPKVQPRDDDRRYIQNRKVLFAGGGEQNSLWPSV